MERELREFSICGRCQVSFEFLHIVQDRFLIHHCLSGSQILWHLLSAKRLARSQEILSGAQKTLRSGTTARALEQRILTNFALERKLVLKKSLQRHTKHTTQKYLNDLTFISVLYASARLSVCSWVCDSMYIDHIFHFFLVSPPSSSSASPSSSSLVRAT